MQTDSDRKALYLRLKKQIDSGVQIRDAAKAEGIHWSTWYTLRKAYGKNNPKPIPRKKRSDAKFKPKLTEIEVVAEKAGNKLYLLIGSRQEIMDVIRDFS